MIFTLALLAGMQAAVPDNWQFGGGRSWMNPPALGCRHDLPGCREELLKSFQKHTAEGMLNLEAAAKRGNVPAMRLMGHMLLGGVGVEHDPAAAMGWFYEAALRGDRESMLMLGDAFGRGVGVTPDPQLAAFWLDRANRQSLPEER